MVTGDGDWLAAIVFDIGGTVVTEAAPATPTGDLVPILRPHVAADLGTLSRSFRLGAATNTSVMREAEVRALLARVGIDHHFEVVVTSSDVGVPKPDPCVLLVASERLAVDPAHVLYVGDRLIDEQAASAAGMWFAYVGTGRLLDAVSGFTGSARPLP